VKIEDAMVLHLQDKASKKLVDRKEDVISLVRKAGELLPTSVYEAANTLRELEKEADELGLPLTGDEWGERLSRGDEWAERLGIRKDGGGMHFDDELRKVASNATRAWVCCTQQSHGTTSLSTEESR